MISSSCERMRGLRAVLYLLPMLLTAGVDVIAANAESSRFQAAMPGIAHTTFQIQQEGAEPFSGHAFKIDLDVVELRLVPAGGPSARRRVEEIVKPYGAVVAVNASFFDTEGRTMGLAVDEGRVIAKGRRQSWGALVVDDKKARIVLGADVSDPLAYRLVVQGLPRLVVEGKVPLLKPQFAERTAVCAGGNTVVLVVTTKAETTAFARFLADPLDKGGLGCWDALNLDGGPSAQLVVKLPTLALSLPGGWGVPNALVVTPGRK
jgi:Phosphodiester glycosidase